MADGIFKLKISGQITQAGSWNAGVGQRRSPLGGMRIAVSGSPGEKYHSDIKYSAYSQASTSKDRAGGFELSMRISGSERMLYVYSMLRDYVVLDYLIPVEETDYESAAADSVYDGAIAKHVDIRVMELGVANSIRKNSRLLEVDYESLIELHLAGGVVDLREEGGVAMPMEFVRKLPSDSSSQIVDPGLLVPRRLKALEDQDEVIREYEAKKLTINQLNSITFLSKILDVVESETERKEIQGRIYALKFKEVADGFDRESAN